MPTGKGKAKVEKLNNKLERLVIEYAPIDSIHNNSYNPNRQSDHDFQLLLASIREDGFTQPIIVQRASREIVDGEHRWRAARELGYTEIPIVLTDMTPEQMRIATLRHNRARGSEDVELSVQVLRDLEKLGALDWAQDSLLLDDVELNRLLEDIPVPEALMAEAFTEAWEPSPESGERTTAGSVHSVTPPPRMRFATRSNASRLRNRRRSAPVHERTRTSSASPWYSAGRRR
jgi:hypothetical protein